MLLRKFCVKPKDGQKQRTLQRGCGVSFTLPLSLPCLPFSLLSSVSRCNLVACVTERKLSSSPSSYSPGVVIPLLLSSALRLNANSHAACKYAQCAAVLPYISLIGVRVCVCARSFLRARVCVLGLPEWHRETNVFSNVTRPIKSGDLLHLWFVWLSANSRGWASTWSRFLKKSFRTHYTTQHAGQGLYTRTSCESCSVPLQHFYCLDDTQWSKPTTMAMTLKGKAADTSSGSTAPDPTLESSEWI